MNVLVIWPPHVPSYFNAGHHSITFLAAAYLRRLPGVGEVTAIDAGALNYNWKEVGDLLHQRQFDLVVLVNDFDNIDNFGRMCRYVKALSPAARIVTGGRLSSSAPQAFHEFDLDALIVNGDVEAGIAAYLDYLRDDSTQPAGVSVRTAQGWTTPSPGRFLPAEEWCLPDVNDIPYDAYDRMYSQDQNKFCGIPKRRELVVPAARGCPIGCAFCEVPSYQGLRDRRISVERTIEYIEQSFTAHPFEYVAFYAPTFTLDRKWVEELCRELIARGSRYPWKCATTISHLPEKLLRSMAASGCVRVSVGVETLDVNAHGSLPRQKQIELKRFRALADQCTELGIELNCFVIVGLPGTSAEGTRRTVQEIEALGGRARPTVYSSMDDLRAAKSATEALAFNRQLLTQAPDNGDLEHELYDVLFGRQRVTSVTEQIARRVEEPA